MASPYPLFAYWDGPPPDVSALASAVFRGMVGNAPLGWASPVGDDARRQEPPQHLADWLEADAPDLQGFGLPLPAGADLFFQRVVGASVEFGRSGETVIEIGGAETRLRSAMIEAFMIALCRSAGAAGAWSGAFREDHIHEHLLTLDAAMEAREPGASLPFSRIAEPASEMCVWQGTVGADLAPTSVDGMLGVWQKRA